MVGSFVKKKQHYWLYNTYLNSSKQYHEEKREETWTNLKSTLPNSLQ